jgi:3-deoxy-D-manno-octulosonic-acid transferase
MRFIYNWAIGTYGVVLYFAQFFSNKAKLWVDGRKDWREKLAYLKNGKPVIWLHVASHGEFEQGKNVIDGLYDNYPNHHILLTFFSPSGYELLKNYPKAHTVSYLPLDTQSQASDFIKIVQPKIALFVKYEFWYNYLNQLKLSNVPAVFFSCSFRESQVFFRSSGSWFLNHLKGCQHFFVRDDSSKKLLNSAGVNQCAVAGDTRFDAVNENSKTRKRLTEIEDFVGDKKLVVFGSTWSGDEDVLLTWLNKQSVDLKIIIAPHEINKNKMEAFQLKIKLESALYSGEDFKSAQVLIVDCIGKLKHIYQYSSVNYIGGGFGVGIHNLLEPTSFGKPVVFGPNNSKFIEAQELQKIGAGYQINDANSFEKTMSDLVANIDDWDDAAVKDYFNKNIGASSTVLDYVRTIVKA